VTSASRISETIRESRDLAIDAAIALFALALGLIVLFRRGFPEPEPDVRAGDAFGVLLVVLATAPLAVRRVRPLAVLLVSAGAIVVLAALHYPGELTLIPAAAVHSLAASTGDDPRRTRILGAVAASSFAVLALVALPVLGSEAGILTAGVVWAAAWFAGVQSRLRRERLAELEERARSAEREAERERRLAAAEERATIARELHDSAGHAINAILLQLQAARVLRDREPERAEAALDTVERVARETIGEIDRLVGALREEGPADVEPAFGMGAVDALVERHRGGGLGVSVETTGQRRRLAPAVDRAVYRIVQEALTNATRHGDGTADVLLDFRNGALELTIENPVRAGRATRPGGGHGISGMRERASLLGGALEAGPDGAVFRVHARLPYGGEDG
jgi:signal transduction histidine kinase